jgi:ABC-2 type transport system permease protein
MPVAGSVLMGLGCACLGMAFAAVAAVTAQLVKSGRAAAGLAGGVLGASYLVRAVGDASAPDGLGWLSWLSPVGWWQQTWPFAGDRWWALAPLPALALALAALAYALAARRDFASGLLPDRPGPAAAAAGLRTPLALAWRLQRGAFIAWAAAFAVVGLLVGALVGNVGDFITSPQIEDLITRLGGKQVLTDAYLSFELGMAGVLASAYGVQAAMRLRSEETALRVDPILAGATGRVTWAWSHLVIALGGTALLLAIVGVSSGVVAAVQAGDAGQVWRILGAALVQIPAAWLVVGILAAAFGLAPRLIAVGWVALAGFVLLGEFGPCSSSTRP